MVINRQESVGGRERPVWFLDVDGVVSPYGVTDAWSGDTLLSGAIDTDLAVPYRPDVLASIQQVHLAGWAEVRWLTTWDEEALSDWGRVGFGPFAMAPRPSGGDRSNWKFRVVAAWLAKDPHRRAVWTDDDATPHGHALDPRHLLVIAPDHAVGLTNRHVEAIVRWLQQADRWA